MSSFLVISDEFYPYENASTNCLLKVLQQLVDFGHDVTVLCCGYDKSIPTEEIYKGCKIKRIYASKYLPYCYNNFPFKQDKIYKRFFYFALMFYARIAKKHGYKKLYNSIKQDQKFAYILSVHCPHKNHEIAYKIVKKEDKWILYNFDPYVFNYHITKNIAFRKLKEKKWAKKTYKVVCAEGILEENDRKNYKSFNKSPKLSLLLPNFNIDWNDYKEPQGNKTILRYTGAFYNEIRNPDYLISLLKDLDPDKFSVEFYGACCNYLKENYAQLPECFKLKGTVPVEECHKLVETADILINLGNGCPNQIPSKTFEYIATGNPILNIYYIETDPSLPYLNRYPNILNLKQGQNIKPETLKNFLETTEKISKKHIAELYNDITTEEIVEKFCQFIEE